MRRPGRTRGALTPARPTVATRRRLLLAVGLPRAWPARPCTRTAGGLVPFERLTRDTGLANREATRDDRLDAKQHQAKQQEIPPQSLPPLAFLE